MKDNSSNNQLVVYQKPGKRNRKKSVPRVPVGLASLIRKEMMRVAEKKFTRGAANITARGTIATADVNMISPAMSLGNTSATRVGNQIRIVNFHIDILMCAEPSSSAQPFRLRAMVFRWSAGGNKLFVAADAAAFYNDGATDTAGTGAWTDQVRRLSDRFEILHDSITPVMQWQSAVPAGASPSTNSKVIVSDHRRSFVVPYMHRTITYDDADTVADTSVFLVVQAIDVGTSSLNASATVVADVSYVVQVDYVDF